MSDTHSDSGLDGDHDDPKSGSTLYWMTLCFVFFLVSAWSLHGLTSWVEQGWNFEGTKAPGSGAPVSKLAEEHELDLKAEIRGDRLVLTSGQVITSGLVVTGVDPADGKTRVFVKGIQFKKDQNLRKYTLTLAGKELKFLETEVKSITQGKDLRGGDVKMLAIPYSKARQEFLAKQKRS